MFVIFRRDYIALLNANTLSLDGMAALNSELRALVHDENWNKHEHVQWVVDKASDISLDLINTLRGLFEQDEQERIMDKLITALIGNYGNNEKTGNPWDRNVLSHLNFALLGQDDNAKLKKDRIPNRDNPTVAVVPSMHKLISALVGKYAENNKETGNWDRNLLTNINFALLGKDLTSKPSPSSSSKADPEALVPAINSFKKESSKKTEMLSTDMSIGLNDMQDAFNARNNVLYKNLNSIVRDLESHTHISPNHVHGTAQGPTLPIAAVINSAGLSITTRLERSMVFRNGSEEDYKVSKTWINDTLRKSNLTEEQVHLKEVILSDQELATKVFGPIIREMMMDKTTDENIAGKETNCNVFHFRNNPLTVHDFSSNFTQTSECAQSCQ